MNRVAITCSSLSIMLMMCMKLLTRIDVVVVTFTRFFSMLCITSSLSSSSSQLLEDKACAKQVFSVMMPSFLPLHSSINFVKLRSCQLALKVRWSVVVMFSERWNDSMVCLPLFKLFQFLYIKYWLHKHGFMFFDTFFLFNFFCVDHYDWIIFHKSFTFLKVCNYRHCFKENNVLGFSS